MPYADPEKKRLAQAKWYREKYHANRKFRHAESDRKAEWLQTEAGKASNAEATARYRAAKRKVNVNPKVKPKKNP